MINSIGILSGTFDPVHKGHLALAAAAMKTLNLNEVYFVVEPAPRGKSPLASTTHRKKMLTLALQPYPKFKILSLSSNTFTTKDFDQLKLQFLGQRIYLIFGDDAYENTKHWFDASYNKTHNIYIFSLKRNDVAAGISSKLIRDNFVQNAELLDVKVREYIINNNLYS